MPTSPTPIAPLPTPVPSRNDPEAVFIARANAHVAAQPVWTDEVNGLGENVYDNAVEAAASAVSAAASASSASISATAATAASNYIGEWTGKTGAYNVGISVSHKGAFWRLNTNTASIQTIEPGVSSSWTFTSGTRWTNLITSSQSVPANSMNNIEALSAIVEIPMPTFALNEFLVLHNLASSLYDVRVTNPTYTIQGPSGTISPGDNLVLKPGDTVSMSYPKTNLVEVE